MLDTEEYRFSVRISLKIFHHAKPSIWAFDHLVAPSSDFHATNTNVRRALKYSLEHNNRFQYVLNNAIKILPPPQKVADIGCHRLDQSILFRKAGYDVYGYDVSEFIKKEITRDRAVQNGIELCEIHDLSKGLFSKKIRDDYFDIILFTEILEHLAFNPIRMWKEIFRIVKSDGIIIITTPNSFHIKSFIKNVMDLIMLRRIGINVNQIFQSVTYGHHWKEYSKNEINRYFKYIGVLQENISIECTHFPDMKKRNIRSNFNNIINMLFPIFRPYLFVVISLNNTKPKIPNEPMYIG